MVISDVHRMGMPPKDVPGIPQEAWRPPTLRGWWNAIISYLDLLDTLLADEDPGVRHAAEALVKGIEPALSFPRVMETWSRVARTLVGASYDLRRPVCRLSSGASTLTDPVDEDDEI